MPGLATFPLKAVLLEGSTGKNVLCVTIWKGYKDCCIAGKARRNGYKV